MVRPLKLDLSPCCEITLFEQATNSVLFSRDNSTTSVYNTLANEIQCYGLPYGGLGFASHVLTYYTIICLWYGRRPMMPFWRVKHSWLDLYLGVVGLIVSTAMAIVTIVKCRNTWQLLVIAVWKMSMSLLNGITAIHVAVYFMRADLRARREDAAEVGMPLYEYHRSRRQEELAAKKPFCSALWWTLLCKAFYGPASYHNCLQVKAILDIPGMISGMSGLMNLVQHSKGHKGVLKITAGFYVFVGLGLFAFAYVTWRVLDVYGWGGLTLGTSLGVFATFSILAVFYSDWVLGMMTSNLVGLPSKDSYVFYWTYFISKRLPMFSW